ncbi:unnamed protein product, partial [Polarella glacialis]
TAWVCLALLCVADLATASADEEPRATYDLSGLGSLLHPQHEKSLDDVEAGLLRLREESRTLLPEAEGTRSQQQGPPRPVAPVPVAAASTRPATPGAELESIRSTEVKLAAENTQLRQQLRRWRSAAATVEDREAKAADLLKLSKTLNQKDVSQGTLSLLGSASQSKNPLDDASNSLRIIFIFVCVNAVAFLLWRTCESYFGLASGKTAQDPRTPLLHHKGAAALRFFDPMLRLAGYGDHEIEVSEFQVGNLPPGGDVFVAVQAGGSREARTEVAERPSAGLLCFKEPLRVTVLGGGSERETCVFRVVNADLPGEDTVAVLEISTKELMRRVRSKTKQQYFNFHMVAKEHAHLGPRPQLAMRLRDVTNNREARSGSGGGYLDLRR